MSNYLAIAAVTATLRKILTEAVSKDVPNAKIKTVRPDSLGNGNQETGINIFLYQATQNTRFRNEDLPTRRANGTLNKRPLVALDLQYIFTFFGDDSLLEPQRLMGSAVSSLHTRPVLTRDAINAAIKDSQYANTKLDTSDLAEQLESIKFTPLPLNLEELSKLWSVFFQTPYSLSISYQGSVVLIESDVSPSEALPARETVIYTGTLNN